MWPCLWNMLPVNKYSRGAQESLLQKGQKDSDRMDSAVSPRPAPRLLNPAPAAFLSASQWVEGSSCRNETIFAENNALTSLTLGLDTRILRHSMLSPDICFSFYMNK